MAYAAVVSLMQVLEDILGEQYQIPWEMQQIESLLESMSCFHDFLTRSWKKRSRVARCLERKIRDAAYKAEDAIESYVSEHHFAENEGEKLRWSNIVSENLKLAGEEIKSIKLKVTRLDDLWRDAKDLHHKPYSPLAQPSKFASGGDSSMVGLEDGSLQLRDRILGQQSRLQIIPVVGMGGIGKTTLVKNAFHDESIPHYFDLAAWVTVSQNYRQRDILLGLLESMRRLTTEMHQESDEDLSECLYKCLKGKRYLIVMDDMWHKDAWENIKRLFPDDNMGSRVLLTTRLSDVAACANSSCHEHHLMRLLNENESWNLLHFKVFGDEKSCPTELEEVGKKIARSCQGLPLSVVVISALLSKVPRTLAEWESVAKNLNSVLLSNDSQCSELIYFSYDHLPHHLKACFLYTGVFPLGLEIPISKLIKLWIAEGFIKSNCSKRLEKLGEEYLDDLMSRNLILVGEKGFDGKIKTCVVHDLLREWCLSKALEEMLILTLNANTYNCREVVRDPRHLCICKDSSYETLADILGTTKTFPRVRSLLSQNNPYDKLRCCKLLRVLDLSKVVLEDFPHVILKLVRLTYVSVCCYKEQEIFIPEDLSDSLRNLQTLIIHQRCINSSVHLPRGIWRMPHLRHLQLGKCYFPHPQEGEVLENLGTISYVSGWNCTKEFIQGIPNIKKLGIRFEVLDKRRVLVSSIRHLGKLHKLEILKCIVEPGSCYNIARDLTLPRNLKKLTLRGTRISWKDMSTVGSLPNLEVLKLQDYACEGSEWEPIKGEFCRLKFLCIEGTDLKHWRAEKDHFPILERLILFECPELEEIPLDFVYLETLESIDLDDASPSAVTSARQIQAEQQDLGNEVLKVFIHKMWQYIYDKRKEEKERKEEMERRRIEQIRRCTHELMHIWVMVSQNYRKRDILLHLLEFMRKLTTEMHQQSDEGLSECLYKCLKSRRYLIVMDDTWHKEAWEVIKRLFPDDNIGSRVLLTTWLSDVATYVNLSRHEHHLMLPLNDNKSWNLLHFKVFGDEKSCPTEPEEVGKKIARSCQGLPLSVVVISALLSKVPRTLAEWKSIAKNLKSVLLSNDSQCSELLYFSYDHLPHHLKACFLYTGVFPLDLEMPISKLIKLWIAEGFIKCNCSKRLEELGEEYLDDLMSKNLILVGEKGFDGKIKTCVVHDLLREWCLSKALEEMFIHTLNANTYNCREVVRDSRHLCICKDSSYETLADILGTTKTFPRVRSLLSQNNPHDKLRCCKLLRVLDLSKVDSENFLRVILELVRFKYVSVCCDQEHKIYISEDLPDSLRNLQTLVIHQRCINSSMHLPRVIWRMPHLRHLQLGKCYFPHPQEGDKNSVLENLQTLSYVRGWSCTK